MDTKQKFFTGKKPVAAWKVVPIRYASSKRSLSDWPAPAFAAVAPSQFQPIGGRATNQWSSGPSGRVSVFRRLLRHPEVCCNCDMTVTNFGANMMRPMPFTGYPFQGRIWVPQKLSLYLFQYDLIPLLEGFCTSNWRILYLCWYDFEVSVILKCRVWFWNVGYDFEM